ncbi:MAG: hypothetical protein Q7S56_00985 [Nanoarchaeota archaeon]|nr:hypothetical protein [Nanoarchaeota archaeon]
MKKGFFILLLFLSAIFLLSFANADTASSLNYQINSANNQINNVEGQVNNLTSQNYWNQKWDYLGQEWQKILLQNSVIAAADGFFKKINIVFVVLFGIPYEMSLVLLAVFFLWLLLWNWSYKIIKSSGIIGVGIWPYLVSLLFVIALSQIGFIRGIVLFTGNFVFSQDSAWARTLLIIGIVFVLFLFNYIDGFASKYFRAKKENDEKRLEELNRTILGRFMGKFMKASGS